MNESWDFAKSMKNLLKALELAEEHGMDPLGDEVFLIKWYIVMLCEKGNSQQQAIDILAREKQRCLSWIEQNRDHPEYPARRARLLSRAVDFSTRMAELYTSEYVGEAQKSEECLVWSLETTLKERKRREGETLTPEEEAWFSDEQLEGQLEGEFGTLIRLTLHLTDFAQRSVILMKSKTSFGLHLNYFSKR